MTSLGPFTASSKKFGIFPKGNLKCSNKSDSGRLLALVLCITAQGAAKKLPEGVSPQLFPVESLMGMPISQQLVFEYPQGTGFTEK